MQNYHEQLQSSQCQSKENKADQKNKGKKNVKEQVKVAQKFQSSHISQSSQSKTRTHDRSKITKPVEKKKDKTDEKKQR